MVMDYSIVPELEPESDIILEKINSKITTEELKEDYGKFTFGPLPLGQGTTVGNSLRRVLYSSIIGTAITWVKIEGILHEYSTIENIKESVEELLLNFKSIRIKSKSERSGKLRLEVDGEGKVSAADIMASSDFEIVNPELHLATLDTKKSHNEINIIAVNSKGFSELLNQHESYFSTLNELVSLTKGLDHISGKYFSDYVSDMFSNIKKYGLISGPSFAKDLCYEKKISVSFASSSDELSNLMIKATKSGHFQMMPTTHIYHIEIAGIIKNIAAKDPLIIEG